MTILKSQQNFFSKNRDFFQQSSQSIPKTSTTAKQQKIIKFESSFSSLSIPKSMRLKSVHLKPDTKAKPKKIKICLKKYMNTTIKYEHLWLKLNKNIHQFSMIEQTRSFLKNYNEISVKFNQMNENLYELNKKLTENITNSKFYTNASNPNQ